jgi:hypothetical protein
MRLHWSLLRGPEAETDNYNPEIPGDDAENALNSAPENGEETASQGDALPAENEGEEAPAREPESQVSTAGRVLRDLISHVTNDMAIGKKGKSGERRRNLNEPAGTLP